MRWGVIGVCWRAISIVSRLRSLAFQLAMDNSLDGTYPATAGGRTDSPMGRTHYGDRTESSMGQVIKELFCEATKLKP